MDELAELERERKDLVKYTVEREEADEMLEEAKKWETKYKTLKSEIDKLPIVLPEGIENI